MTRGRKIFAWTVGILLLLLALLIIVIATFDWNRLKPTINEKVSTELHRPFAINGNLAVLWRRETEEGGWRAWVPWPHMSAEDITLGNPEWSKNPQNGDPQTRRDALGAPAIAGSARGDSAYRPDRA